MGDIGIPKLGSTLRFKENSWKVIRQVHDGPFSKVLMLQDSKDNNQKYAMKIEPKVGTIRPLLKLDVCLLTQLRGRPGFPELVTAGRTEHFNFCVMKYVGPDLEKLQNLMPTRRFTASTAYRLAFNTLDSLEELHKKGWLHRDLKAQNFAVGLGNDSSRVYMLDFGMARSFRNRDGQVRGARKSGPYCGTYHYNPLAAQYCRDQGAKDDLEGWFYMNMHMMRGHLPWHLGHELFDHGAVREWKEHMKKAFKRNFFNNLPNEWETIYDMVMKLRYEEVPAYNSIRKLLNNIVMKMQIRMNEPLDWQVIPPLVYEMNRAERELNDQSATLVQMAPPVTEETQMNATPRVKEQEIVVERVAEKEESMVVKSPSSFYADERSVHQSGSPIESQYYMEELHETNMVTLQN